MSVNRFPERLIKQGAFFKRFNVDSLDYKRSGLNWRMLEAIYADYSSWWDYLHPAALYVSNTLALESGVHAVSHRVKDPEHLIEKIIRRSKEKGSPWATLANYRNVVRDLIGVRALHLFKEDWRTVHASIKRNWKLTRRPVAKVRDKDPKYVVDEFKNGGCKIERLLDSGYRSVHYEIEVQVAKAPVAVELQARTLFEEAWGEVSHRVQYPYFQGAELIERYLIALSEMAGMGDSVASAVAVLREWAEAFQSRRGPAVRKLIRSKFDERTDHIVKHPPIQNDLLLSPVMLEEANMKAVLTPKKK